MAARLARRVRGIVLLNPHHTIRAAAAIHTRALCRPHQAVPHRPRASPWGCLLGGGGNGCMPVARQLSSPPSPQESAAHGNTGAADSSDGGDSDLPEGWRRCFDPGSKRTFFHNADRNVVSWAHPDRPDEDVFASEIEQRHATLAQVNDADAAPLARRLGAVLLDMGISLLVGGSFAGAVYVDLGDAQASIVAFSFALWGSFVVRDAVFEQGTRSLGKRALGLEIVTPDGQLPVRRHTVLRNLYFIAYGGATAFGDLAPLLLALAGSDLLLLLFSPGRRKLGDWLGSTKVISERSDRPERLSEKKERNDEMMSRG